MRLSLFAVSIICLCFTSLAQARNIEGVVKDIFVGELEPMVVGDTCLLILETPNLRDIALISDFDFCNENEQLVNTLKGQFIDVGANEASLVEANSKFAQAINEEASGFGIKKSLTVYKISSEVLAELFNR